MTNPLDKSSSQEPGPQPPSESEVPDFESPTVLQPGVPDDAAELLDQLAADFLERCRQGESPELEEYIAQAPGREQEIRELFPAMLAMEQLKAGRHAAPAGRVAGSLPFRRMGDFRIVREVGRGGMGIVYEAEQLSLRRRVAIKVLPRQLHLNSKQTARFQREARTAANLHHANIIPVYGAGVHEGFHFIVMHFVSGVGLDRILNRLSQTGARASLTPASLASLFGSAALHRTSRQRAALHPSPAQAAPEENAPANYWQTVAWIGIEIAQALDYAHEMGVLHRDIKPGNLLLDEQGRVLIADFGLARTTENTSISGTGEIIGTLTYMAPEQLSGNFDRRSDLYSLGQTLYEFLTLKPTFSSANHSELIRLKTETDPPSPRQQNRLVPRDLETIVLRAMAREPQRRYQSAGELAEDLQRFLDDRPILAHREWPWERLSRWSRRNPALATLSGISLTLLLSIATVTGVAYFRTEHARTREQQQRLQAEQQRQRAEKTLDISLAALDDLYARFAPDRLLEISPLPGSGPGIAEYTLRGQPALSPATATLLESILTFYDRIGEQNTSDDRLQIAAARATKRVGDLHMRLGQAGPAELAYARAAHMYEQHRSGMDDATFRREIARIQNAIGSLKRISGDDAGAAESHTAALAWLKGENEMPSPEDLQFERARTLFLLSLRPAAPPEGPPLQKGSPPIPPDHGDKPSPAPGDNSLAFANEAIGLLQQLLKQHPGVPEYRYLQALCYRQHPPHTDEVAETQALSLLEGLSREFPQVAEYRLELSKTYANVDVRPGRLPESQFTITAERFRKALALLDPLVQQSPDVPEFSTALANLLLRQGTLQLQIARQGDPVAARPLWRQAEAAFRRAIELQGKLVERFPGIVEQHLWLARMELQLGRTLIQREETTDARTLLQASLARHRETARRLAPSPPLRSTIAEGYRLLAQLYTTLGQTAEARSATEAAQEFGEPNTNTPPFP